MTRLLLPLLSLALLLVRGVLALAAPALVLLLFAFPPSEVQAFLVHAPVALLLLLLLLAVLLDFCSDLWSITKANSYEARFFPAMFFGWRTRPLLESLLRLERASRWRMLFVRGEWLFVPLWLCAAAWINVTASLPLIFGSVFGTLLLFFGVMILRLDAEGRERGIADNALRFATSLSQARVLGRLTAYVRYSVERHRRARGYEQRLAIASTVILMLIRLCAAVTLVATLLYGLTLVGRAEARLGEVVALLMLLRSLFALLDQQARKLAFYAPDPSINHRDLIKQNIKLSARTTKPDEPSQQQEASTVGNVLEVSQGTVRLPYSGSGSPLSLEGLALARGEVVALTGESASGKSLLLKACAGLYPSEGLRFLGELFEENDDERLATLIGYVPQEVALLEGTIAENISSFQQHFDEARLVDILTSLGAHKSLAGLSDGLATRVDPFDNSLHYGLKVQILIAAALYNKPRLLLFDAAVASLDAKGIASFARVLASAKQRGVAVIVVAQQPDLLQICDHTWSCAQHKVRPLALA